MTIMGQLDFLKLAVIYKLTQTREMENKMPYIVKQSGPHGSVFSFDFTHYYEVWKARKDANLPTIKTENITQGNFLTGKRIFRTRDCKPYTIVGVYREWFGGWYIKVIMEDAEGSSAVRNWQSIDCWNPDILEGIAETHQEMLLDDFGD